MFVGPGRCAFTSSDLLAAHHGWNLPVAPWKLGAALLFFAMLMAFRIDQLPRQKPMLRRSSQVRSSGRASESRGLRITRQLEDISGAAPGEREAGSAVAVVVNHGAAVA